jgi:hypothetical protein
MWKVIQLLLFGHAHKWKTIDETVFKVYRHPEDGGELCKVGTRYVLQCEQCGTIKKKDVV